MAEALIDQWGYAAIFVIVVLGNLGLPVPEEGVLLLAGYLVWKGRLRFVVVVIVGVQSAALGDNLGYWFGRHYGQAAIRRYGHKLLITSERLERARRFVARYGSFGVFVARFVPGLRSMAGPLAGSAGLPCRRARMSRPAAEAGAPAIRIRRDRPLRGRPSSRRPSCSGAGPTCP